eukprot:jgi/Tetstr1/420721/TSEL_011804.t1
MPVTRRAAAAATMADHGAAAAVAAAGFEAMEIDTHVARVIQVELAKTKTRVPTRDIINASRILGDRREVRQLIAFFTELRELIAGIYWTPALEAWILRQFPLEPDAGMAYRGLTADNPPVSREVALGVSVSTIFADIDDFQSKLVACFHSNSNLPGVIMRYATALRIAPNHPHLPGTAIKLAQHLRRTFDLLPVHRRYDEFTVVGVIQACLPHSAQVALEAASRRADEPIDYYSTICRHLEDIDLERYGHRRACVAAGGRGTRDEGVIWKGDPGDFYMKVIAKKFRGVWHYGVITGVVTEWVLEDYGGATQWRAVFEDGGIVDLLRSEVSGPGMRAGGTTQLRLSGKVTVQSGGVMEDCLHHMETFSILNAGPLLEEARVKAIMPEKELASPAVVRSVSRLAVLGHMYKRLQGAAWFVTRWGLQNVVTEEDGPERKAQRGAKARRPGQRGAKARQPGQRGAKARRPGQRGAKARRPGQRGAKARRPGQRGAKARRPGQRGAKARRPGQRGAKARRPGQRGAKTAHTAESAERGALQAVDGSR